MYMHISSYITRKRKLYENKLEAYFISNAIFNKYKLKQSCFNLLLAEILVHAPYSNYTPFLLFYYSKYTLKYKIMLKFMIKFFIECFYESMFLNINSESFLKRVSQN